ncbi:MAG: hypothetical protein IPG85_17065 [Bacteroidetes bacterium]|nr:hypothetical protein [Bacteroidota bacterium]
MINFFFKRINNKLFLMMILMLSLFMLFQSVTTTAQVVEFDSTGMKIIKISHADSVIGFNNAKSSYQRLLGAVTIEHDGFIMTCDSAHLL